MIGPTQHWLAVVTPPTLACNSCPTHTGWQWWPYPHWLAVVAPPTLVCSGWPHPHWLGEVSLVHTGQFCQHTAVRYCIILILHSTCSTHVHTSRCIHIEQPQGEDGSASLQYVLGTTTRPPTIVYLFPRSSPSLQVQFVTPWSYCGPPRGQPWHPAAPE